MFFISLKHVQVRIVITQLHPHDDTYKQPIVLANTLTHPHTAKDSTMLYIELIIQHQLKMQCLIFHSRNIYYYQPNVTLALAVWHN